MREDSKLKVFMVGVLMGTADAVPGVSGGTIALIVGVYNRLIASITSITLVRLVELFRALTPMNDGISLKRAGIILDKVDFRFLLVLLTGIVTAVISVGQVVEYLEAHAPVLLFGFFFGLIGASALVLTKEISVKTKRQILIAFFGFLLAFVLSGDVRFLDGGGLIVVFLSGGISVSAMILPGVSGSLLLVILGQYTRMYSALGELIDGVVYIIIRGQINEIVDPGRVVLTFLLGGLVGVLTIARLIRKMLTVNREATMAFLVALIFGALRAPITELSSREGFAWTTTTTAKFATVAIAGSTLVFILARNTEDFDLAEV